MTAPDAAWHTIPCRPAPSGSSSGIFRPHLAVENTCRAALWQSMPTRTFVDSVNLVPIQSLRDLHLDKVQEPEYRRARRADVLNEFELMIHGEPTTNSPSFATD
jgi:hypothetical protein